jgi:hypothetical protein
MGLRSESDAKALDVSHWHEEPGFASFCREFLVYQMETLRPRLVVILGPVARVSVDSFGMIKRRGDGLSVAKFGCHTTAIHLSSHPYGDLNFTDARKADEAVVLRGVWDRSSQSEI